LSCDSKAKSLPLMIQPKDKLFEGFPDPTLASSSNQHAVVIAEGRNLKAGTPEFTFLHTFSDAIQLPWERTIVVKSAYHLLGRGVQKGGLAWRPGMRRTVPTVLSDYTVTAGECRRH
jgi:hypothetical protein